VSFGNEFIGKTEILSASKEDGKDASIFGSKAERSTRKNSFAATLENARERRKARAGGESGGDSGRPGPSESKLLLDLDSVMDSKLKSKKQSEDAKVVKLEKSSEALLQELVKEPIRDMTVDLNEPCSKSGRYWKQEYQSYHDEARSAMMQLLRYKQLATSYAKKKDDEANELAAKLKEEQQRVIGMENKVSKLSSRIRTSRADGKEDESPELIKELARQTALAVQYRAQVEEFKAAVELTTDLAKEDNVLPSPKRERKKLREQLREIASLRDEVANLRQTVDAVEKTTKRLQEENTKLTQDLLHADLRFENYKEKAEKQRQSLEDQVRKRDQALSTLQKEYDSQREQSRSTRRDGERLIKLKGDQVAALKKEVAYLKGADTTITDLQTALEKKDLEHSKIVANYIKQIAELKRSIGEDIDTTTEPENVVFDLDAKVPPARPRGRSQASADTCHRESLIPVLSSISRPSKSMVPIRPLRSDTPTGSPRLRNTASFPALSEITNSASTDRMAFKKPESVNLRNQTDVKDDQFKASTDRLASKKPNVIPESPAAFKKSDVVQATPFTRRLNDVTERFNDLTFSEMDLDLPSPEPSLPIIHPPNAHARKCHASPRPSMLYIASSPPKPVMVRPHSSDELSRQRSIGDLAGRRQAFVSSSRSSNLDSNTSKTRSTLPPERAAAAKARLAEKNREKQRMKEAAAGKENIR
jgi:hypothetical protein